MTWPFENDTSAITKKLAKKSLQSEKRRNLMVVIAVALAAFLICFTGIVSTSLTQMQRNQVVDTYEAVWLGVEENDIETLKGLPEFERVGGYYMLGEELSEQGYHASYVYCDAQMMEITKAQMELLEGRVPEKANEVVVSKYFLSTYGNNAKIGDTVTLDTESFHGDYVVTGIMDSVNEKEANTCAIILSNAALTGWKGFDPTGYRAYVHFKNSDQLGEELMTSYCREIAEEYQLPMPKMNSKYYAYASKSFDFALMAGVIALVLIGGYIVGKKIGIYCENTESDACKKRIDGIKDTLAESGCVVMWIVSGVSDTGEKINLQSQRKVDIVLAIDDASVVEAAKEASDNNLQGALVYGIGNSTEAIYYLDSGWTEALITPDEFAAGYKSVVGLVDMLRGSRKYSVEEKPVSYQLLTRKNLFDEENKKLLYAISQ